MLQGDRKREVNAMARQVLGGRDSVKVAAVQAAPVFMDTQATVEKACRLIKQAGTEHADLVAFSETFIPGYPCYYTGGFDSPAPEWLDYNIALQDNAIVIPGDETVALGEAARQAGCYVVMGCNELDERRGSRTLYNTLVFLGRDGSVLGTHRKLMPTYTERTYWGCGDGTDLRVFDTEIGSLGGLICWEHHMILARAAMIELGEEIHVAVWPGTWRVGARMAEAETVAAGGCDLHPAIREHAFEAGAFVISVSGLMREQDVPRRWEHIQSSPRMNFAWAVGGSTVVSPMSQYLVEPVFNEETIIYAECPGTMIKAAKVLFDSIGHYSRPDLLRLQVRRDRAAEPALSTMPSRDLLRRIAETYEISEETLAAIVVELQKAS